MVGWFRLATPSVISFSASQSSHFGSVWLSAPCPGWKVRPLKTRRRMALSTNNGPVGKSSSSSSSIPVSMSSGNMTSNPSSTVNLMDLAAAAIACTVSASRQIQKIADPANRCETNVRSKNDGSVVTDADLAAQYIIVQSLRTVSQTVSIVGEESEEDIEQLKGEFDCMDPDIFRKAKLELRMRRKGRTSEIDSQKDALHDGVSLPLSCKSKSDFSASQYSDLSLFQDDSSSDLHVDVSRVCIVVDPLDGTKSYAVGEYDAVSILIAIILDNKPCFGVIGKPFGYFSYSSILDTNCVTIYGGQLLGGVYVAGGKQVIPTPIATMTGGNPVTVEDLPRAVISSSRSKGVVQDFCWHLGEKGLVYPEPMLISGAGEKSLRLILQQHNEAVWFFPKPGTSLWDVAAPDALLRSLGGKLTDKYGKEMDYSKSREQYENVDGVVACIDEVLHAQCIQLFKEGDWLNHR